MITYGFIAANPETWDRPGIVERLRALKAGGASAPRIARILSDELGAPVTRGAVLGTWHRMSAAPSNGARRDVA